MGERYFTCENCSEANSEYDEFYCEKGHSLCSDCLPNYFDGIGIANDIYLYLNKNYNDDKEIQEYITENDDYGYCLKEKYCPVCQRKIKNEQNPEYKIYLRLKEKFEGN